VRAQRGQNFKRLADAAGLPYGDRSHWFDSEPAHEASEWAIEQGAGEAFRHAVYDAYFVKNINIGSADVLVIRLMETVGAQRRPTTGSAP
jgi:predicted DsbA family dithiol-disulfide isomerase